MFATLAGLYPPIDGPVEDALRGTLADQLEAGLGMVADGRIHRLERDADVDAVVAGWALATELVADLAAGLADADDGPDGVADAAEPAVPPVKVCLAGPLSLATAADPAALDGAVTRVRAAIGALHAAGVAVVQIDEPWSRTPDAATDAGRERAAATWAATLDGVTGHVTLALPGGGPTALGVEPLVAAPFASHLVDLITGPDDWRVVGVLPGERGVILGVADLRPGRRDDKEVLVWAIRHAAAMHGRGLARVGLTTSAGLERLPRTDARERLAFLARTAQLAKLSGAALAQQLDPRAVDARSAALGRWEPRPRRGSPGG